MKFTVEVEPDPGRPQQYAVSIRDHLGNVISYPARNLKHVDAERCLIPIRHAFMAGMAITRAECVSYLTALNPTVNCSLGAK